MAAIRDSGDSEPTTMSVPSFTLKYTPRLLKKKYFPLIKEAMEKGEIEPGHVALLEDRILMREGKKQVYGSQLRRNEKTGKYEMWPVEDEENLDKRRLSVGLEPIAEYLKRFGVTYIPPRKK